MGDDVRAGITVLALLAGLLMLAHGAGLWRLAVRVRSRWAPPPPEPTVRPLQRLAADVRRLRDDVRHPPPGQPMARRRGIVAAYDDLLDSACRALEVANTMTPLPPGPDRDTAARTGRE